jgi:hypothetical protein
MTTVIKQFEWDSCSTAMDITMTSAFIHNLHWPPRVDKLEASNGMESLLFMMKVMV